MADVGGREVPGRGSRATPVADEQGAAGAPDQARTIVRPDGSLDPRLGQSPPPQAAPATSLHDRAAPRHQLLKLLGKGGMGEVYAAVDPELRRKVAFKRLLPEWGENPGMSARFLTEVQVTAQLDHPNVVPVNGFELAEDGTLGYSMKLIKGRDLSKLIEKWRGEVPTLKRIDAPRRQASRLDIFLRICEAMTYAHGKGVLHRDLKPENVMVGLFNDVYVMDWGIFRLIGDPEPDARVTLAADAVAAAGHGATRDGMVLGTTGYMSPEQANGRVSQLDERSDVFTLGVILAELITLRPARQSRSDEEALALAQRGYVAPLLHLNPHLRIARELKAIVARATQVDPARRYRTVKDLSDDLRRFLRGDSVMAKPDNPVQRMARWLGRHRMIALTTILALAATGAGVVAWQIRANSRAQARLMLRHARHQALAVAAARHADALDENFARWKVSAAQLVGRASEAMVSLSAADPTTPVYLAPTFDSGRGPADLAQSARYGTIVSVDAPVVQLAPGLTLDGAVRLQATRIAGLRDSLQTAVLATSSDATVALSDADVRDVLLTAGVPALRAFVTLASGVHVSYPGYGGYAADYDGRKRKKYTSTMAAAQGIDRVRWGEPFADRRGLGLVLPIGGVLFDRGAQPNGVAGLEISLAWVAERRLALADAPWADEYFLLDGQGRALIQLPAGGQPKYPEATGDGEAGAVSFTAFTHEQARQAIASAEAGVVQLSDGRLAALYPLSAINYTFVVIADPNRMAAGL